MIEGVDLMCGLHFALEYTRIHPPSEESDKVHETDLTNANIDRFCQIPNRARCGAQKLHAADFQLDVTLLHPDHFNVAGAICRGMLLIAEGFVPDRILVNDNADGVVLFERPAEQRGSNDYAEAGAKPSQLAPRLAILKSTRLAATFMMAGLIA